MRNRISHIKKHLGSVIFCAGLTAFLLDLFLSWRGALSQRIELILFACAFLGVPAGLLILRVNYLVKTILSLVAGFCGQILIVIMANIYAQALRAYISKHSHHQHYPENIETAVFVATLFMLWCVVVAFISLLGGVAIRLKEHISSARAKRNI